MEKVSYTSQWTAAARALESERGDGALFKDDYARVLAGPKGFELLDRYNGAAVAEFVALRTRFIDEAILDILARQQSIEQVVFVASGMDTRAFRLQWPKGAVLYEVDHVDLLAFKNRQLLAHIERKTIPTIAVGADLASNWMPKLVDAGYDPARPTLWMAEALFFFLTETQAAALLNAMAAASALGSWLITDMISKSLLSHPITQPFLRALKDDGIPWLFGTDDPEGFFQRNRWHTEKVAQPGEQGAGAGWWKYPPVPRDVRGVPRNWLITARRA